MKPGSMSRFVAQGRIAVGMRAKRLIRHIQSGHTQNIDFGDFCRLLAALGFRLERVSGSHQQFRHPRAERVFPVQPRRGQAKPYQVRELLDLIRKYDLRLEE